MMEMLLSNDDNTELILTDFVNVLFEICTFPDMHLCKMNKVYLPIHYSSVVCGPQRLYISRIYMKNDRDSISDKIYLNPSLEINYGLRSMGLRYFKLDECLMEELNDYQCNDDDK